MQRPITAAGAFALGLPASTAAFAQTTLSDSVTETGHVASSRFCYPIEEKWFLSNDTDILKSGSAPRLNVKIGRNLKMTSAFSARISDLTEDNQGRAIETDNTLGVAFVFSS